MKKMESRALLCLIMAAALIAGLGVFIVKLVINGGTWASFYANTHVYSEGRLAVGAVYDRNGELLLKNDSEGQHYNEDYGIRRATLHVVGDKGQNISTGANYAFRSRIVGYNIVTGTKGTLLGSGRDVKLTIDAQASKTAYNALNGYDGFVGVYNYKTGEILCLVSSPGFDPESEEEARNAESGSYINKVISATATPGSTFKLVTTAAALENIPDINEWSFKCNGSYEIEGEKVTCETPHGTVDIYGALSNSCNCAYSSLAVEMGGEVMQQTVDKLGLTSSYDINGIKSVPGSFNFDTYNINLGWAGIGQFEDQVNPLSMMVYIGAIAGGGEAAEPCILQGSSSGKIRLLEADTAQQIGNMMRNNVVTNYGDQNYPGLELHAKSGTAEGAPGRASDAWFCGYSGDLAFVVCVERGGYGAVTAGPIASKVLQALNANS